MNTKYLSTFTPFLLMITFFLSACTEFIETTERQVTYNTDETAQRYQSFLEQPEHVRAQPVVMSEEIWLGNRGYANRHGDPLPSAFRDITLVSSAPQGLQEIAGEISQLTDLPVFVENDLEISNDDEGDGGTTTQTSAAPIGFPLPGLSFGGGPDSLMVNYSGSLQGLLDYVASRFGYSWEYRDRTIYFLRFVTRTFSLNALPGNSELLTSVNSDSGGADAGAGEDSLLNIGSTQDTQIRTTLAIWEEIEGSLNAIVPEGSRVHVSPATGSLTVTTTPWAMRQVESFLDAQNDVLGRQVAIHVRVLSITRDRNDDFNFDISGLLESTSEELGLSVRGPVELAENALGVFGITVLDTPDAANPGANNRADALFQLLSSLNGSSLVTSAGVTTLNNQPAPVQVIRREAYLRQAESIGTGEDVRVALTPGEITTGFMINLLPRIMDNGEIMLQYGLSLSEQVALEEFTSGGASLQLPTVVSRDFLQQVRIRSNNTLVLAGYERNENEFSRQGTGEPSNFLLGGSNSGSDRREMLVIMITPKVIDSVEDSYSASRM